MFFNFSHILFDGEEKTSTPKVDRWSNYEVKQLFAYNTIVDQNIAS
jgi:hypothetical protein